MENKKIRNTQAMEIDGIKFKSKLEVYCYKRLLEEGLIFDYEKYVFVLQDKFTSTTPSMELLKTKGNKKFDFASNNIREITYKPDFVNIQDRWIIECKGFANDSFAMKWKMFKYLIHRDKMDVSLYLPRNQKQIDQVIELIKNDRKI